MGCFQPKLQCPNMYFQIGPADCSDYHIQHVRTTIFCYKPIFFPTSKNIQKRQYYTLTSFNFQRSHGLSLWTYNQSVMFLVTLKRQPRGGNLPNSMAQMMELIDC